MVPRRPRQRLWPDLSLGCVHCRWEGPSRQAWGRCQAALSLGPQLGPGEGEGGPFSVIFRQQTAFPKRVSPWICGVPGPPTPTSYSVGGAGALALPQAVVATGAAGAEEEGQVGLVGLEQGPSQGGELMLIFTPAPPSMLPVAVPRVCLWRLLAPPAPACGQLLLPVWGSWVPPLSQLLFRAWRCLGCRGWHVWLCLSSTAR